VKKIERIIIIVMLVGLGWVFFHEFGPPPPDGIHGKLKVATVTMRHFSPAETNTDGLQILEKTIVIQQPSRLAAIEQSLKSVPNNLSPNSMEGLPRYHMQVQYMDGKTQSFVFTKTEFGYSGRTPRSLLEELKKNGLYQDGAANGSFAP